MGVHGLWDLLAPVGRRVSVETLSGRKLAIDASIWMIQFMKAMRDEKGEMVRNAHLIGFFRRICKLLYLRTKPVFVFDGGTPALKRRTVVARRRLRENAQAKIRKTAEKLLLNHLKEMRLKELAKDLKDQRMKQQEEDAKGKKVLMDNAVLEQSKLDEMLAASIAAEENGVLDRNKSTLGEGDANVDEEMILPAMDGNIDPSVLAALPPSMQLDLLMRASSKHGNLKSNKGFKQDVGQQDDMHMITTKGKEILSDDTNFEENNSARNDAVAERYNQGKLDEMLAASIVAEERKTVDKNASTSGAAIPFEEGGDEDEEMILPDIPGRVDPAVLAALPPSMQLDLLVQMRERLMAENRQRYQKVKKAPEKFSELQIEAYLKTVAFRREINQVQKAASGHGVGGVQTSRIASEANREFIFSSSFTGDKQFFISTEEQRNGDMQQSTPIQRPATTSDDVASIGGKSSSMTGLDLDESRRVSDDDVETYLDERGRIRLSRVRAMGMRMTRDLQRNLDLMKEIEKEETYPIKSGSSQSALNRNEDGSAKRVTGEGEKVQSTCDNGGSAVNLNEGDGECLLNIENSIQISFEIDEGSKHADSDDDIFASLVEEKPIEITSTDNNISRRQPSDSDGDWEEGITSEKVYGSFNSLRSRNNFSFGEGNNSDGSEVEWEEGVSCDATNSPCQPKSGKSISKGHLEEEYNFQEAIRRSLKDIGTGKSYYARSKDVNSKDKENANEVVGIPDQDNKIAEKYVKQKDSVGRHNSSSLCFGLESLDVINTSEAEKQNKPSETHGTSESCGRYLEECSVHNLNRATYSAADQSLPVEIDLVVGQSSDSSVKDNASSVSTKLSFDGFHNSISVSGDKPLDGRTNYVEAAPVRVNDIQSGSVSKPTGPSVEIEQKLVEENNADISNGGKHREDRSAVMDDEDGRRPVFTEASLEEEILNLGQERINLGDQQRKLERNAESISSEMFAECQELLQMFGLPYIIAPMEAEAQCAYMELANLVDGVVTDDSDVFLFGARSVHKNLFDDRKYVETYFMKDIEKELGLTREKLIRMALLLGSDYTEGVSGIGIVNAIEVVNAFHEDDGLHKFQEWIESPDPTILGNFGAQTMKKDSKVIHEGLNPSRDKDKLPAEDLQETKQVFMNKHRNVSKNWHIPPSFPSEAVISAYVFPQVDKSTEPFSWGKPDIHLLRRLCWEKFGWGVQKSDELLVPVLNEYNKHETQLRLEAFYTFNEKFAKIRSKRIKKAVKGITGNHSVDVMDNSEKEVPRCGKKRRIGSADSVGNKSAKTSKKKAETVPGSESSFLGKGSDQQCQVGGHGSCNSTNGNEKSRGRGTASGRGKGRGKRSVRFKKSDSSSSDDFNNSADEREIHGEKSEGLRELRRSARSRNPAKYTVDDMEIDDVNESLYEGDRKRSNEKLTEQSLSSGLCMDAASELNHNQPLEAENRVLEDDNYFETGGGFCADKGETTKTGVRQNGSPLDVDASEDHLKTGGGFCADEGETVKLGASQSSSPFDADVSKDYLKTGGGYYLDETDKCNDQSALHNTLAPPTMEVADASSPSEICEKHCGSGAARPISCFSRAINELSDGERRKADIGPTVDLVNVTYSGDYSRVDASGTGSTRGNAEASGIRGLSPMPQLKRKKRKS